MKYAIIKTGGKQYIVKAGDKVKIEKLAVAENDAVELTEVLMTFDDAGKDVKIGYPTVPGAKVTGKVLKQGRAKKVTVVKYKPKTRYTKKTGHRQMFTEVEIVKV